MRLLRYGPAGGEKPGLLDDSGTIRDLSGTIDDIAGDVLLPEGLDRLRAIDPASLPAVGGEPRLGPCIGSVGKFIAIGLNFSRRGHEAEGDHSWVLNRIASAASLSAHPVGNR